MTSDRVDDYVNVRPSTTLQMAVAERFGALRRDTEGNAWARATRPRDRVDAAFLTSASEVFRRVCAEAGGHLSNRHGLAYRLRGSGETVFGDFQCVRHGTDSDPTVWTAEAWPSGIDRSIFDTSADFVPMAAQLDRVIQPRSTPATITVKITHE